MKTTKRLRWKREPSETGLARVCQGPRGFRYHDGETEYASVSPLGGGWRPMNGWYWVVGNKPNMPYKNTCSAPVETPEQAKAEAEKYVKECLEAAKVAQPVEAGK